MNGRCPVALAPPWPVALSALLACAACATKKPATASIDVSRIRHIAVLPFAGPGGPAVANEFIRELLAAGLSVSQSADEADAVLSGNVTDYRSNNKLMVYLGQSTLVNGAGQTLTASNPVVSTSGAPLNAKGSLFGLPNAQVVFIQSSVNVVAHLSHRSSGRVLWSDEFGYEGIDLATASQAAVDQLMQSFFRAIPRPAPPATVIRGRPPR
ncbi:MAG TPA: LptE family protein [Elusimicrobiota bacterium]|nr:LptE family protein [Elusimicrobiota bacterium]